MEQYFHLVLIIIIFCVVVVIVVEQLISNKKYEENIKKWALLYQEVEDRIGPYIIQDSEYDRFICESSQGRFLVIHENIDIKEVIAFQSVK